RRPSAFANATQSSRAVLLTRFRPGRGAGYVVLLKEGEHPRPGVLGCVGAVARPIVGVESVRRVGIDLELADLAVSLARCGHAINAFKRDALISAAVQPEHRAFQVGGKIDRVFRLQIGARPVNRPIPRDRGLQARVVRGVKPDRPAAPAKSGDGKPGWIAFAGRSGVDDGSVEIRDHLGIRHLRYYLSD